MKVAVFLGCVSALLGLVDAAIIPSPPAALRRGLTARQAADAQTSLGMCLQRNYPVPRAHLNSNSELDPSLIGANLASTGLVAGAEAGQVASLTSTNNLSVN